MVKDFFKGFLYTLGKILAFIFILLVIGTLLTKINTDDIKVERLPFKQILMNLFFVNGHAMTINSGYGCIYPNFANGGGPSGCSQLTSSNYSNGMRGLGLYISNYTLQPNNGMIILDLHNISFCSNSTGTFTGNLLFSDSRLARNSRPYIHIGENVLNCSFTQNGDYAISFTCASNGLSDVTLSFNVQNLIGISGNNLRFGVSFDVVESCNINANEIIVNNNQNTQNIINSQQETTNAINDINDTLQDTTISGDSIGNKFADIYLISDTPITDLLTMPLHLLQKIYNSIQTECTPYTLPFDFGFSSLQSYTISLPCLNLGHENRLGRVVWGYIDDLCCIFMIYNIFKMVIYFYDSWTSLKDNFDWLIDPSTRGLPY